MFVCPTPLRRAAALRRQRLVGLVAALLAACGGPEAPLLPAPVQHGRALEGAMAASSAGAFHVRPSFHDGQEARRAAHCTGADLWFFADAAGAQPARRVDLEGLEVIMPCCHSRPAAAPRGFASPSAPGRLEVADICPSKSGGWELRVRARLDDGPSDEAVIQFAAR